MPEDKFKKRLILNDGAVLEDCECGYASKMLWCFLSNIPFGEAFQYFSSPDKYYTITFELEYENYKDIFIYSGLEQITSVVQSEFTVDVRLEGYHITIDKRREIKVGE